MRDNKYVLSAEAAKKADVIAAYLQTVSQDEKLRSNLLNAVEKDPRGVVAEIADNSIQFGDVSDHALSRLLLPLQFYLRNEKVSPIVDLILRISTSEVIVGVLERDPFVTAPSERPPIESTDRHSSGDSLCQHFIDVYIDSLHRFNDASVRLAECIADARDVTRGRSPSPNRYDLFGSGMPERHSGKFSLESLCEFKMQEVALAEVNAIIAAADVAANC